MISLKILAATVILSTVIATPVFAQAAISEPGAFAFYHPDADVLHSGSTQQMPDALASLPLRHRGHIARAHTGSMLAGTPRSAKAD